MGKICLWTFHRTIFLHCGRGRADKEGAGIEFRCKGVNAVVCRVHLIILLCKNSRHSGLLYFQWLNQENVERLALWLGLMESSMSSLNLINPRNRSNNNISHIYCIAPFMKDLQACCEHSWTEHHCPSLWSGSPLPAAENIFFWETLGRGSYRGTPGSRQIRVCPCACNSTGHFTFLFSTLETYYSVIS